VPKLKKNDSVFGMNSIHHLLPSGTLAFVEQSRRTPPTIPAFRKINQQQNTMKKFNLEWCLGKELQKYFVNKH